MISSYYGPLFKNMWKENVDKREGKYYRFCHRMQWGKYGESNSFRYVLPCAALWDASWKICPEIHRN